MISRMPFTVSGFCLVAVVAACGGSSTQQAGPAGTGTVASHCTGDLANLTYTGFARNFLTTYCGGCHSPGGPVAPADWTNYANVVAHGADIDALAGANPDGSVVRTVMPPSAGPSFANLIAYPTTPERVELSCWIATGAQY